MKRRVVVTGLGFWCPLGTKPEQVLWALRRGIRSFKPTTRPFGRGHRAYVAAQAPDLKMSGDGVIGCLPFLRAAARAAWTDAILPPALSEPRRAGVVIGTLAGGNEGVFEHIHHLVRDGTGNQVNLACTAANLSREVADMLGCFGECCTPVTACAAGTTAVGVGLDLIRWNRCDLVVVGGAEVLFEPTCAGFSNMEALSSEGCRPFDRYRDGLTVGEGAAVLLLEEADHALRRGARIYAEVLGYGLSNDAYHLSAPDPKGGGAIRAMQAALAMARVRPSDVSYINAHGTATPYNDAMELHAITAVFGEAIRSIPISSTKGQHGHAMGATGAIEAAVCVLAIADGVLPATVGLHVPCEPGHDFVPEPGRTAAVDVVLSNSFGFGGSCATLVMGQFRP